MKKFCITVYLLIMALFVLTMSGCGGSSSSGGGSTTQSAQSKRMVFTSSALKRNGSYNLYRGDNLGTIEGITSKYYLAPVTRGNESITMNLEFANAVSQDLPFMITESDGSTVLFYYNPKGIPRLQPGLRQVHANVQRPSSPRPAVRHCLRR